MSAALSVDRFRLGLRLFGSLRALFFEEGGLVLHVADERVHDGLCEAEYGGAEDDAGDAEGVRARDEADEHPVEVEALGAARGELRPQEERGACGHRDADEKVGGRGRRPVLEDEQVDADGDVDGPLAEQREEAYQEGRERQRHGERHAEDEVHHEYRHGLQRLVYHHREERAAERPADVQHQPLVERHEVARNPQLDVGGEPHALRQHVEEREEEDGGRDEQERRALANLLEQLARAHDRLGERALKSGARVAEAHRVRERAAYALDYLLAALLRFVPSTVARNLLPAVRDRRDERDDDERNRYQRAPRARAQSSLQPLLHRQK